MQRLFAHAAFWQFSESPNGLTLIADKKSKKSEMHVSKSLKRKKGLLLKNYTRYQRQ